MLDDFLIYVRDVVCLPRKATVLLALSGGVDSMVLMDLLLRGGYSVVAAHVDHLSRAGQSTADADWVVHRCSAIGVKCHLGTYVHGKGNFQKGAREYRYGWMEQLCNTLSIDYLLTAHHADDLIEGLHLGLARGRAGASLLSLLDQGGRRRRPLLFADKQAILAYAVDRSINYRKDTSNENTDYNRNYLRHEVLPLLVERFANYKTGVLAAIHHMHQDTILQRDLVQVYLDHISTHSGIVAQIPLDALTSRSAPQQLLYHALSGQGWTHDQLANMLDSDTGATFTTTTHEALVDRDVLHIRAIADKPDVLPVLQIEESGDYDYGGDRLHLETDRPVILRRRLDGDRVVTSGGSKLLKKLLIDHKLSAWNKEEVIILSYAPGMVAVLSPQFLATKTVLPATISYKWHKLSTGEI